MITEEEILRKEINNLRDNLVESQNLCRHATEARDTWFTKYEESQASVVSANKIIDDWKAKYLELSAQHHTLVANLKRLIGL